LPILPIRQTRSRRCFLPRHLGFLIALALAVGHCRAAAAQALPTATRAGDLQVGVGYSSANSDYAPARIQGLTFYSSFDFLNHFGVEVDFHQLNQSGGDLYERTYEAGGRYIRHWGKATPYIKGLFGRGVLNYPNNYANLAYNMAVGGGGMDIGVQKRFNIRLDAEYQTWFSGPGIVHGITPLVFTGGVAYHFGPGKLRFTN
jgi:hypothetical protein